MTHEESARSAKMIFVCVHREHYEFLEKMAPQLERKVSPKLKLESKRYTFKSLNTFKLFFFSLSFCESTFLHFHFPAGLETIFNILCTHRLLHLFPHVKHDSKGLKMTFSRNYHGDLSAIIHVI